MTEFHETPLQGELYRWTKDFREDLEQIPRDKLYHYTTVSALRGILKDKCFRMTHYGYLNDPSEFRYSLGLVDDCLARCAGAITPEVMLPLRSLLSPDRSTAVLPEVGPYIVSFSEENDSLYEWRAYADNGNGVCIGIEPPSQGDRYRRNLARVVYDRTEQNVILEQYVQEFLTICSRHPKDTLCPLSRAGFLYRVVMDLRANFKHPAYFAEREWRYTNFAGEIGVQVFERDGKLVPYFPATKMLGENNLLPITEIRLGPRQDEMTGRHSVRLVLEQHGYDADKVRISKSEIPYGWRC